MASPQHKTPPFSLRGSRIPQNTYFGRFRSFLHVVDPRTLAPGLFFGRSLEQSVELLNQFENGTVPPGITDEDLWTAKKIKNAAIHPDTGNIIPMPFRMSGFIPFGSPVVVGMLLAGPGVLATMFWQSANQSHNAAINYCNANATHPAPVGTVVQSFLGAVVSAVAIAISLNKGIQMANSLPATTRFFIQRFVPFPAVALSGVVNVMLMRRNEFSDGIDVVDDSQNVVGTSKIAARKALFETSISRIVLPAPVLIGSPLVMTLIDKVAPKLYKKYTIPIQAAVVIALFSFALPACISLFPQQSSISGKDLEPEFHDHEMLYFNKGL